MCEARRFSSMSVARVMWTYMADVNSVLGENSKVPSSSTISAEASFNDKCIKETLNVNKVC